MSGVSALEGMGEVRGYRRKNGQWVRVRWFPQIRLEIVYIPKVVCVAIRNGKEFHDANPDGAIQKALDDA